MSAEAGFLVLCNEIEPEVSSVWGMFSLFSNSRRRHDSEEGDSHRRHKHKKSKRSKEGKETSGEPASEQENTEAAPVE